jgi:Recombinase
MSSRRHRRKLERQSRQASPPASALSARDVRTTAQVQRLAYTRKQAAEALGVSLATLDRRVVPVIETVKTEWGARLIPVDQLERYLAERRQQARAARRRPEPPGRKSGLDPELVGRIRRDYSRGSTLADIARRLNADGVRTSQSGRQWWPSTVRAVLVRPHPPTSA